MSFASNLHAVQGLQQPAAHTLQGLYFLSHQHQVHA